KRVPWFGARFGALVAGLQNNAADRISILLTWKQNWLSAQSLSPRLRNMKHAMETIDETCLTAADH
ncbi:MAG: hypothetical protein VCA34_17155, partial [Roseibacillus sp.]